MKELDENGKERKRRKGGTRVERRGERTSFASSVKKGPRTVPSVAGATTGWFMASTRAERPRTSERRMNS